MVYNGIWISYFIASEFHFLKKESELISDSRLVSPLVRGMKIIELLSEEGSLTLEQVATRTRIPRTSIFRLLNTLEALGYLEREHIKGMDHWRVGLKVLILVNSKLRQLDMRREIRDILKELAEKTNEFVQLGVFYHGKVMYIDHVERPKLLTMYAEVGSQLPINVSAAGMVLAAALEGNELEQLLNEQTFLKNTPKTLTKPNELRKILRKVAHQGYAIDDQQYALGIRCIAAPVFDHKGEVIAAINITGSLSTITDERIPVLVDDVKAAGEKASERMGYNAA